MASSTKRQLSRQRQNAFEDPNDDNIHVTDVAFANPVFEIEEPSDGSIDQTSISDNQESEAGAVVSPSSKQTKSLSTNELSTSKPVEIPRPRSPNTNQINRWKFVKQMHKAQTISSELDVTRLSPTVLTPNTNRRRKSHSPSAEYAFRQFANEKPRLMSAVETLMERNQRAREEKHLHPFGRGNLSDDQLSEGTYPPGMKPYMHRTAVPLNSEKLMVWISLVGFVLIVVATIIFLSHQSATEPRTISVDFLPPELFKNVTELSSKNFPMDLYLKLRQTQAAEHGQHAGK